MMWKSAADKWTDALSEEARIIFLISLGGSRSLRRVLCAVLMLSPKRRRDEICQHRIQNALTSEPVSFSDSYLEAKSFLHDCVMEGRLWTHVWPRAEGWKESGERPQREDVMSLFVLTSVDGCEGCESFPSFCLPGRQPQEADLLSQHLTSASAAMEEFYRTTCWGWWGVKEHLCLYWSVQYNRKTELRAAPYSLTGSQLYGGFYRKWSPLAASLRGCRSVHQMIQFL